MLRLCLHDLLHVPLTNLSPPFCTPSGVWSPESSTMPVSDLGQVDECLSGANVSATCGGVLITSGYLLSGLKYICAGFFLGGPCLPVPSPPCSASGCCVSLFRFWPLRVFALSGLLRFFVSLLLFFGGLLRVALASLVVPSRDIFRTSDQLAASGHVFAFWAAAMRP